MNSDEMRAAAMAAKMGEFITTGTKAEANVWKKRMLSAGIPGLDWPSDWDSLSEEEKEERLNKVIDLGLGAK